MWLLLRVAAHECGHAVQHARAYQWLNLRSRSTGGTVQFQPGTVGITGGIVLINIFPTLLLAGIILFAVTTVFSLVTLPVEFDASRRALLWLDNTNLMRKEEHDKAEKDALWWADLCGGGGFFCGDFVALFNDLTWERGIGIRELGITNYELGLMIVGGLLLRSWMSIGGWVVKAILLIYSILI